MGTRLQDNSVKAKICIVLLDAKVNLGRGKYDIAHIVLQWCYREVKSDAWL